MDKLRPPPPFSFEGNVSQGWKIWQKHFQFFLTATESDTKSDKIKTSILLTCIGPKGRDIYETFTFEQDTDKLKLKPVLEKFTMYCNPRKNITILRHKFFTYKQVEGQCFNDFVTELKKRSSECEFGDLTPSLTKDMIVCGITDNPLRERLLRDADLTLEKAIAAGHAAEETKRHAKELKEHQESADVHKINRGRDKLPRGPDKRSKHPDNVINKCKFCSGSHQRGKCPAYGKRCHKCQRKNHFEVCCPEKEVKSVAENNTPTTSSSDDDDEFYIDMVTSDSPTINESSTNPSPQSAPSSCDTHIFTVGDTKLDWSVTLEMNGADVPFKIDTGAQCNVIPKHLLQKLSPKPKLKPATIKLSAYNGTPIPVSGKCIGRLKLKGRTVNVLFIVVDSDSVPILGLNTSVKLNLIKQVYQIPKNIQSTTPVHEEFSDCFGEIGCLPRVHHIEIRDDVKPVISPVRKIPCALKPKLKKELQRMVDLEIIEPVEKPTDWVNALVIVSKPNGDLRICLDPRPLNKAIKRQHHRLPTAEEILSEMAGAQYFSKMDASSGYWQVKVDDESADLLTFGTPFGRYRFKRLPFGIHSASEVFQAEVASVIANLPGCANSQDDIIVWGTTKEEHDSRLRNVLTQIRASGLKLNPHKCVFGSTSLTFLGHTMSPEGVKPDPSKVEAITQMPPPKSKADLQRFMGMVNYVGKFIPNLSQITAPLRQLLKKGVLFDLQQPQLDAINEIKRLITSPPCLKFYDPNLPTRLKPDASQDGLGALLEQNHRSSEGDRWFPIAYASRALLPYEKNYAQIEKETLSIVFGVERFHEYLYGRQFTVINDHQPLKSIFNKSISQCPPRIQRFFLKLQKYDFDLEYAPGKTMVVSDALSRAYLKDRSSPELEESDLIHHVHSILDSLPISTARLTQLQKETASDPVLQQLKQFTLTGWPQRKQQIPPAVKPYYAIRGEISHNEGLLLKGQRIIIPASLRPTMKAIIHQGHNGIARCKSRARQSIYWPGMNSEIDNLVSRCPQCLTHRNQQQKETLIQHTVPKVPWTKVASDLFTLYGHSYVIVTDYTSKYIEIERLPDKSSLNVVNKIKKIFARHGIPKELYTDNGPEYTAQSFKRFAKEWDFKHITSSPHFPQSNGLVERAIQTVKKSLKKAHDGNEDPYLTLLILNTTPGSDGASPAMRLFNHQPRTTLPSLNLTDTSSPSPTIPKKVKKAYDQHAKDLTNIEPGTVVRMRVQGEKRWDEIGKVVEKCQEPRAYRILNSKGNVVRRNRRHLLPCKDKFRIQNDHDDHIELPPSTPQQPKPKASSTPSQSTDGQPPQPSTVTRSGRVVNIPARYR